MIPHDRPVMAEADIAAEAGMELHTWRRRHGADFRSRVPVTNPGERLRLYDAAQARAYVAGQPIPPTPPAGEPHPDDLLSTEEVAAALSTDTSTVRAYASTGYLPQGVELHGRRFWPRRVVQERIDAGDQRHHPERTGAGRRSGDPRNQAPRGRHSSTEARVQEVAAALAQADSEGQDTITAADLAQRYDVSHRTGERLLAAAREHLRASDPAEA
ncbi:DNA-binding protein (plasmid) [Streptomyces sp. A2-16]|uniref:helix-turn-helix transcriptional regulator n=1 Tax=Streptomyces sp. A2-16 TaxID=2781734 RepID=UPI001BAF2CE6|nr:DNA-binding protein [Streptomyces sp. A2-16]QUC63804.1 DNA-binding protein [Streptomyces sp. A2-16]